MLSFLLFLSVVARPIDQAPGWTLAKDEAEPYCFVERREARKLIVVRFNALEEKISILFIHAREKPVEVTNHEDVELMLWKDTRYLRTLRGFSARSVVLENGSNGLLLESDNVRQMTRLSEATAISASSGDRLIASSDTPAFDAALSALEDCSRRAKTARLDSL